MVSFLRDDKTFDQRRERPTTRLARINTLDLKFKWILMLIEIFIKWKSPFPMGALDGWDYEQVLNCSLIHK